MRKEPTIYIFEGTPSGDGECFCWNVTEQQLEVLKGTEEVEDQRSLMVYDDEPFRLYPDYFFRKKTKCRITLTIEELHDD